MKISNSLTVLALLCFVQFAKSQSRFSVYSDSLRLEFPDQKAIVVFQSLKMDGGDSVVERLPAMMVNIASYVEKSSADINTPYVIEMQELADLQQSITIRPISDQSTRIKVRDGKIIELLPPGWEVFIWLESSKVYIYAQDFNSIKKLAQEDFGIVVQALHAEIANEKRKRNSITARMVISEGSIKYKEVKFEKPEDFLVLGGNAGIGLINTKLYPELAISVGTYFSGNTKLVKKRIELINNYMFGGIKNAEITSFLSLVYSKNFNKKDGRPKWNGVGLGGLLADGGNFFNGATIKVFLITDLGNSKLNLIPELYLSEGAYGQFGMKLNYTF